MFFSAGSQAFFDREGLPAVGLGPIGVATLVDEGSQVCEIEANFHAGRSHFFPDTQGLLVELLGVVELSALASHQSQATQAAGACETATRKSVFYTPGMATVFFCEIQVAASERQFAKIS